MPTHCPTPRPHDWQFDNFVKHHSGDQRRGSHAESEKQAARQADAIQAELDRELDQVNRIAGVTQKQQRQTRHRTRAIFRQLHRDKQRGKQNGGYEAKVVAATATGKSRDCSNPKQEYHASASPGKSALSRSPLATRPRVLRATCTIAKTPTLIEMPNCAEPARTMCKPGFTGE